MEQNIIEINSLTDYIREIKKIPSQSYFRGEDKKYSEQRTCAFRACLKTFEILKIML